MGFGTPRARNWVAQEPSASDDVVPHAVNCQAGAPEKGCASICHWLEAWTRREVLLSSCLEGRS